MSQLQCIVVTPETTVLDEPAEFVALPLDDGEIGIAPGHSPMIGRLGFGELRLRSGNQSRSFLIEGGFVQIANNVVSVLTNQAKPVSAIDPAAAAEFLDQTLRATAAGEDQIANRERLQRQARAQLQLARKK